MRREGLGLGRQRLRASTRSIRGMYLATTGPQRLRIQMREDGLAIDQVVLSAVRYLTARPGRDAERHRGDPAGRRPTAPASSREYPRLAVTLPFLFFSFTSIGCQPPASTPRGVYVRR